MLDILYEDNHLIAVSKKTSDLAQGDITGDVSLDEEIKKYLAVKYNKPGRAFLGVVHRLDRPVSGVILYARTSKALARLNKMFSSRQVRKTYLAIVGKGRLLMKALSPTFLKRMRSRTKPTCMIKKLRDQNQPVCHTG